MESKYRHGSFPSPSSLISFLGTSWLGAAALFLIFHFLSKSRQSVSSSKSIIIIISPFHCRSEHLSALICRYSRAIELLFTYYITGMFDHSHPSFPFVLLPDKHAQSTLLSMFSFPTLSSVNLLKFSHLHLFPTVY